MQVGVIAEAKEGLGVGAQDVQDQILPQANLVETPIQANTALLAGLAKARSTSCARAGREAPSCRVVAYWTGVRWNTTSRIRSRPKSCTQGNKPGKPVDGERTAI
jgi:hypothetical protein